MKPRAGLKSQSRAGETPTLLFSIHTLGIGAVVVVAMSLMGWLMFRQSPRPSSTQPDSARAPAALAATGLTRPRSSGTRTAPPVSENRRTTNLLARLSKGESLSVTLEQLEPYLQANHRDAESLLAAYQATHERALLDEAIAKYPSDPRVAYTAWFRSEPGGNDPDALKARRQALDVLKQAAPDNALANYLSAANYFKSGQPDQAIQDLQAAAAKPNYNDYTQDAIQSMTEAYLAAGYSEADSKLAATSGALLPHLAELKQDGLSLVELAKSYQRADDAASAQAALQMCLALGQRLDDPNALTLIQTLVGIAVQRMGLEALAGIAPDADARQAVQDRLNALLQHREAIKATATAQSVEDWLQTASPQDVAAFCDRERLFGEQRAMQWVADRQAKP